MSYLQRTRHRARRGAMGMGDSIVDQVLDIFTLGAAGRRQRNLQQPFQAVADFFGSYSGAAPYVGALVTSDGELQSQDFADEDVARASWLAPRQGVLYAAVWDRANSAILDAGMATTETISVTSKFEPFRKSSSSKWWLLALLAGGAYYLSSK